MLIEEIMKQATQTAHKMSPEEKANLRRQLDARGGCGIQTSSRNQLCDVCDSILASLTRNSAACQYWRHVDVEVRSEVQRIKYLCGMQGFRHAYVSAEAMLLRSVQHFVTLSATVDEFPPSPVPPSDRVRGSQARAADRHLDSCGTQIRTGARDDLCRPR